MFKLLCRRGRISPFMNRCFEKTIEVKKYEVQLYSAGTLKFSSTNTVNASTTVPLFDKIPEPPHVSEASDIAEAVQSLSANGEPTLASMGLGGWTPVGWVQNGLEFLHVSFDIPWWGAILIGTVLVRISTFPFIVMAKRNSAIMNNYLPQIQTLQQKMTDAKKAGNEYECSLYRLEMQEYMKSVGYSPLKAMWVPVVQAPIFISFFMGLRGMANYPVESMTYGGLWWFTDLTVPDQFYLLPIMTSLTLAASIELGADGVTLSAQKTTMKYFVRSVPWIMLIFSIKFPGAILVYWSSSNLISLVQVGVLKFSVVKKYLKIPELVHHSPDSLPIKYQGIVAETKETWDDIKRSRNLASIQRVDEIIFTKAGRGPLQKTYKYDPTKPRSDNIQQMKKKSKDLLSNLDTKKYC